MHRTFVALLVLGCAWAQSEPVATLSVTDKTGHPQENRPFVISRVFKQGDIQNYAEPVVDGQPLEAWQCDRRASWPDGSLKHAVISFHRSLESNQTLRVGFRNSTSACHLGDLETCHAAAIDGAAALSDKVPSWNGVIEATHDATHRVSARDMLANGHFRYWLRGPVVSQLIVEDRAVTRSYDFGWGPSEKGLHPMFVVTFFNKWDGVKVEAILENMWSTELADQSYSLTVRRKDDEAVYNRNTFTHYSNARWRQVFWNGHEPGTVRWDWNLPYLIETRAIPNYDRSIPVTKTQVDALLTRFQAGDKGDDFGDSALWLKAFGTTGGRPDIGWLPAWYVQYLFQSDERLEPVMSALGSVAGHAPLHYRESLTDPAKKWCPSSCTGANAEVPGFGRPVSVETRPQIYLQRNYWQWSSLPPSDRIIPLGPTSAGDWRIDIAHHPSVAYLPYLLTGDYYLYEEMLFWTSHAMGSAYFRGGEWGLMTPTSQMEPRGQGWAIRTVSQAAFLALDGSAEQEYLNRHLAWQAEYMEGYYDIRDGNFPPQDPSCPGYRAWAEPSNPAQRNRWCHGRMTVAYKANPMFFPGYPTNVVDSCRGFHHGAYDCEKVENRFGLWMAAYQFVSLGMALDMGHSSFGVLFQKLAGFWIDGIMHPDSLPHLMAGGGFFGSWYGSVRSSDKQFFTSWKEWKDTIYDPGTTTLKSSMGANDTTFTVADPSVIGFRKLMWTRTAARGQITRVRQEGRKLIITFANPHGLAAGDIVTTAGANVPQFNSVFTIAETPVNNEIVLPINIAEATTDHVFPGYSVRTITSGIPIRIGGEIVNVCGIEHDGTLTIGTATLNSPCNASTGSRAMFGGVTPRQGWPAGTQVSRDYTTWNTTVSDAVHGYPWVARAAHSFAASHTSPSGYTGQDAWAWIEAELTAKYGNVLRNAGNPSWAILPRGYDNGPGAQKAAAAAAKANQRAKQPKRVNSK